MRAPIIVYILFGIVFNIVGPLAKRIKQEVTKLEFSSLSLVLRKEKPHPKWKVIIFEIILRLLVLFFYPLVFLILKIDSFRDNSQGEVIEQDFKLKYFHHLGGTGPINCNECGYVDEITSSLHGFGKNPWSIKGVQCQKCGKFAEVSDDIENSKLIRCECGGSLKRDEPIFCPKCKSKNLSFRTKIIT